MNILIQSCISCNPKVGVCGGLSVKAEQAWGLWAPPQFTGRGSSHHGCCKACSQVNLFSGSFSIKCRMKSLAEPPRQKQRWKEHDSACGYPQNRTYLLRSGLVCKQDERPDLSMHRPTPPHLFSSLALHPSQPSSCLLFPLRKTCS